MIELKELIRALRRGAPDNLRCLGCGYEHNCGIHGCRVMKDAADALEATIREQEQRRWIPVTERLPDPFERVIVCRDDGKVEQGCKDIRDWWKVYGTRTKQVTHWMPLPEPPKEGHL